MFKPLENESLPIDEKSITKVKKIELINYLTLLNKKYPLMFKNHKNFKTFLKSTQMKTKSEIVDIINYYVKTKNIDIDLELKIKGVNKELRDLVSVSVKKVVHKVS